MIKNYFLTALRNMKRNKINSLLNISALSIAIACVIFIMLYVQDEMHYDSFLKDVDHIFLVNMKVKDQGVSSLVGGNTAPAVAPTMQKLYPEIEAYTRVYRPGDVMVRYEVNAKPQKAFTEHRLLGVDSNFLQIFNFPLLQGDPKSCFAEPNSVVITKTSAVKYFGAANPIGQLLLLDTDKKPFFVTGVLADLPSQSSFQFDLLTPIGAYAEVKKRSWNWFWLQVNSYVKLKPGKSVEKKAMESLESKFSSMARDYAFNSKYGQSFDEFTKKGGEMGFALLPFKDVHLHARALSTPARMTTLSDIKYIYIFSSIAFFLIVLACVNFMNLSTAQSGTRAKEVGIRKVLGSGRAQLIRQFLGEAMLYALMATLLGILLVCICIPPFNAVSGKLFTPELIAKGQTPWLIALLCLVTGLLAGLYPAFYLTSFNPVSVLKGMKLFSGSKGLIIRDAMVVFQFAVSITLIICTAVVFQQLKYTRERDLGLNRANVVEIANTKRLGVSETAFRDALAKQSLVTGATISGSVPTKSNFGDGYTPEATENDHPLIEEIGLSSFMVDEHFIPTFKMQILAGRNFLTGYNDSASVILNETAAKQIGWKNPVGKYLAYPGNNQRFKVIGVVKDFTITSLHDVIEPFALFANASKTYTVNSSYISVRLKEGKASDQVATIEKIWKSFAPDMPMDYSFLDEEFDALYRSEQKMGNVFTIFTALSIFVACLGLFGLSIYTAERRKKEIGVRKVLGASVGDIVTLLSKSFVKLVMLAALISFPLAGLMMNKWLQDFAYRVSLHWTVFAVAAAAAVVIALVTISFQSVKAALVNPARSLKTE